MADAVEKVLAVAGGIDHPPRRRVDVAGGHARPHRRDRGVVRLENDLVDLPLLRVRLPDDGHAVMSALLAAKAGAETRSTKLPAASLRFGGLRGGRAEVGPDWNRHRKARAPPNSP